MGMFVWSLDDGFGNYKFFAGLKPLLIPNSATPYVKKMKSENLNNKEEDSPLDYLGIECEEGKFLVGAGAIKQDSSLIWAGGRNKHKDINFKVLSKACLGVLAGQTNNITINPLVMGLPVEEDESDERHALLQSLMVKEHRMKLIYADGRKFDKVITVDRLITKKQPFGTFANLILDNSGQLINPSLARKFVLIIDIGTRTVNILTLNCLDPVSELSGTFNQGIHTAYDRVGSVINDTFGFKVSSGQIDSVVKNKKIREYDLTRTIDQAYQYLANEIINIVDTLFIDAYQFVESIIVTGGGATVLKPYLEDSFPLSPTFGDQFSAVKGLWKWGVREAVKESEGKTIISLPNGGNFIVSKAKSSL